MSCRFNKTAVFFLYRRTYIRGRLCSIPVQLHTASRSITVTAVERLQKIILRGKSDEMHFAETYITGWGQRLRRGGLFQDPRRDNRTSLDSHASRRPDYIFIIRLPWNRLCENAEEQYVWKNKISRKIHFELNSGKETRGNKTARQKSCVLYMQYRYIFTYTCGEGGMGILRNLL